MSQYIILKKSLCRCIDSILAQTFSDFELLLIDDGSTDSSGRICDEYAFKDSRIRVYHKRNEGASSARNLGLDNANGEWCCFCDADDYVLSNWLLNFVNNIGDIDLILSGYISFYKGGRKTVFIMNNYSSVKELICALGAKEVWGYLWCKCFKKVL